MKRDKIKATTISLTIFSRKLQYETEIAKLQPMKSNNPKGNLRDGVFPQNPYQGSSNSQILSLTRPGQSMISYTRVTHNYAGSLPSLHLHPSVNSIMLLLLYNLKLVF